MISTRSVSLQPERSTPAGGQPSPHRIPNPRRLRHQPGPGLAADRRLTAERLLKEALHELGHTYGLRHCHDWSCPMASSTTVERMDLKNRRYCLRCHSTVRGM